MDGYLLVCGAEQNPSNLQTEFDIDRRVSTKSSQSFFIPKAKGMPYITCSNNVFLGHCPMCPFKH